MSKASMASTDSAAALHHHETRRRDTGRVGIAVLAVATALILQWMNAEATPAATGLWYAQSCGTTNWLADVSCPTTTNCWAVGANGTALATNNGGARWSPQSPGTTRHLSGVSRPPTTKCWAVSTGGAILTTSGRRQLLVDPNLRHESPPDTLFEELHQSVVTICYDSCKLRTMARVNITLDHERTQKLNAIAERAHMKAGTVARSLLSEAIDQAIDAGGVTEDDIASATSERMTAILAGIPGFDARLARARVQAERGDGIPLEDL